MRDRVPVPLDVRGSAQRAVRWIREGRRGAQGTGRKRAHQLATSDTVSVGTLDKMRAWFARHGPDAKNGGTSYRGYRLYLQTQRVGRGAVAWECWGGDAAYLWLKTPRVRRLLADAFPAHKHATKKVALTRDARAVCDIVSSSNVSMGRIVVEAERRSGRSERCRFVCDLQGLSSAGLHGVHVHACAPSALGHCKSTCDHYNPEGCAHGGPDTRVRHRGDLGNCVARGGRSVSKLSAAVALHEILGRSIVVHAHEDDLGQASEAARVAESRRTGNAGPRLGCGVVRPWSDLETGARAA